MGAVGALLFLAVCAALTLGLVALLLRGLAREWAESRRLDALAASEGWRHLGSGSFTGPGGENDWRGGPQQDSDNGDAWTDFRGGVPGLGRSGYLIVPRALGRPAAPAGTGLAGLAARAGAAIDRRLAIAPRDPADHPHHWPERPLGSPAFREAAMVLAPDGSWDALLTPAFEALWFAAHPTGAAPIRVQALDHQLLLKRDDGRQLASAEACVPMLRLGAALLAETRALASHR